MKILTTIVAFGILAFSPLPVLAEDSGGIVGQSIDALFNLRDQLQGVVMKSVKGVGEAMQEGPAQGPSDSPFTLEDLTRKQGELQGLYDLNKNLLTNQRKLQNVDLQLLTKLPPTDARRQQLAEEIRNVGSQMAGTQQSMEGFRERLGGFNQAIQQWRQRNPGTDGSAGEDHPPSDRSREHDAGSGHNDTGHSGSSHSQPGHSTSGHSSSGSGHSNSGHGSGHSSGSTSGHSNPHRSPASGHSTPGTHTSEEPHP